MVTYHGIAVTIGGIPRILICNMLIFKRFISSGHFHQHRNGRLPAGTGLKAADFIFPILPQRLGKGRKVSRGDGVPGPSVRLHGSGIRRIMREIAADHE